MLTGEKIIGSKPVTLRWYAWGGLYPFFYQVSLGTKPEIAFFYEGKQRESRMLSAFEAKHFLGLISKLHLPVADPKPGRTTILPTVETRITLEGGGFKLSITWTNSDAAEMPDVYGVIEEVCEAIDAMLEIDTKALQLPIYK